MKSKSKKNKIEKKPLKNRRGVMGTGKDLAYISDTLFDDDLKN